MESPKGGIDLEKELTCSICTELLYQPLTLLDCLHTFCGSCIKEWFSFEAAKIERAPTPPTPDTVLFTCPSCRDPVRDTRHNATVVTLLDMIITAHPEKARSEADREDMGKKYKPGEQVLTKINARERTVDERRAQEEDERILAEVRQMSLREAGAAPALPPRRRRTRESRSRSVSEARTGGRPQGTPDGSSRSRNEQPARRSADQLTPEGETRRGRRSDSRQRQVEHQSSLRSLISSADMSERDIEREIEEFARQIQEEGLLDGLDLDNIDLTRDDELSRRITEAYRRKQNSRPRDDRSRRRGTNGQGGSRRPSEQRDPRPSTTATSNHSSSRQQRQGRSASESRYNSDRSRPPQSSSATLDVRGQAVRTRRRTGSSSRSTTTPVLATPPSGDARPAARSQTDLTLRNNPAELDGLRPGLGDTRSVSTPNVGASHPPAAELPADGAHNLQSFAARAANPALSRDVSPSQRSATPPEVPVADAVRAHRPAELAVVHSAISHPLGNHGQSPGHQRTRSQLYPEPSISCSRCRKKHIEYELHYNCHICSGGQWNICLDCYRTGQGCLYWFGFGYGAWSKWEKARKQTKEDLPMPHMLTASRYTPPATTPGGAEGRKTLTTDDPKKRLESGTFCARCFVWTNQCYWRCDVCNEGDWGFCNNCVNQGKSCSHMLLPLTHETTRSSGDRPTTPRSPGRPPAATVLTGPSTSNIGPFKPLTFTTRCDVCQDPISPTQPRYHCFSCVSNLIADAIAGDYDICFSCYNNLVVHGEISYENGHSGWRRCLNGHRMAILGFTEGNVGLWRYVDRDIVGGRALRAEPYESEEHRGRGLQKWSWSEGEQKLERLVTQDVKAIAPTTDGGVVMSQAFPPDGGNGPRGTAKWAWYPRPEVDDELLFPRGAEVREIEFMNHEWSHGTYMGAKGLFPAKYVQPEH